MDVPWRPLRHFVLKVASRCDLACDHCYIYEHRDQSWRGRPPVIGMATVRAAARRIAEHARAHDVARVAVVLHGGEPLLLGAARLREVTRELRATVGAACELDLRMQTNGVRLDAATAEVLLEAGVRVGVSLDGDRTANDRHRVFRNGATSHPQTLRALALLRQPRFRSLYAGLLCTVDLANDPVAAYQALIAEEPPRIDLLLPHATWEDPPPGRYAPWLLAVHQRWSADGRPVPIRLFDSIRVLGAGGPSGTEAVGIDAGDIVVIETDGAWEEPDSMKTTVDGGGATGLTVFSSSADEVTEQPAMRRRRGGLAVLSDSCQVCAVVRQCGGGMTAHRYRAANGFGNPSVYCEDLKELIITINQRGAPTDELSSLPPDVFDQLAYGYGDAAAVAFLAGAELAINRALVSEVASRAGEWRTLPEIERRSPDRFNQVIAGPFVRAWAVTCLRPGNDEPDFGRLDMLAAEVERPAAGRFVELGGMPVRLEDADPYRNRFGYAAAGPVGDVSAWASVLRRAWPLVERDAPDQADGLRRGVRAITPLEPAPDGTLRSATTRDAFGAVGIAYTDDPAAMAVMLVHEFQHTKLGAVLDLIDLVDERAAGDRLRVGWRPDPRPVPAALQGTYAHLAIADIWRRRAELGIAGARENYVMYRDWTVAALASLRSADRLTRAGRLFVDRMAATVDSWS
ncbi:MAG TPA: FxsB family cyclophane-forming radical SAM/SPASM peptide maturase [Actinoplanes sp.]